MSVGNEIFPGLCWRHILGMMDFRQMFFTRNLSQQGLLHYNSFEGCQSSEGSFLQFRLSPHIHQSAETHLPLPSFTETMIFKNVTLPQILAVSGEIQDSYNRTWQVTSTSSPWEARLVYIQWFMLLFHHISCPTVPSMGQTQGWDVLSGLFGVIKGLSIAELPMVFFIWDEQLHKAFGSKALLR